MALYTVGILVFVLGIAAGLSANIHPSLAPTSFVDRTRSTKEYKEPTFQWIGHIEKKTFYGVQATADPEDKMGWTTALDHCQELGMSLATIDSLEQDKLIAKYLTNNGFAAWLSGTDYMSEGEWYWFKSRASLDSTYKDSDFDPRSIAGNPTELNNCLYTTYLKNWYSGPCEFGLRRAICQFP